MIAPPENWHKIQSDAERLEVYKKYKFLTSTKTELKELYYKGLYTDEPVVCEIVGYADKMLVISINGELHSIHPAYLLQMQETTERLQNFISIDFETANSYYVPCALGLTIVKNGKITEKKSFLINPWTEILQEKTNIHGITNKDVCNSDTFDVLWERIKTYFEETPYVVAHNISFDGEVLATAAKHYQIQLPKLTYYCTFELSKNNYAKLQSSGAISGYGLDVLCKYFNIPLQHHNCESDSYAAAQIMLNLLSDKDSKIETYSKPISPYSPDKKKKKTRVQEPIDYVEPNIKYDSCDIIFQGKTFVITGTVSLDQTDKAYYKNLIEQLGGDFKDSVSRKTDYLIVGLQDTNVVKDKVSWKSTKITKAEEYKENGIPISIISRQDFLKSLLLTSEDVIL